MALITLPNAVLPLTSDQADGIRTNMVQLNILDAGLNEQKIRAIGLEFKIQELNAKTRGAWNFTGRDGHERIKDAAMAFTHGAMVTRYFDLLAAHVAIDYHNCVVKLRNAGLPPIPNTVDGLLELTMDLAHWPPQMEERVDLVLSFLKKSRV